MKPLVPGDRVEHVSSGKQGVVVDAGNIKVIVKYDYGDIETLFWAKNLLGPGNAKLLQRLARVTGGARFRAKR